MPLCVAVIDIGTNSIKLLVGRKKKHGFETLADEVKVVRLGADLAQSGVISEAAAGRALAALEVFAAQARTFGAETIYALATQTLRAAANAAWFTVRVETETGLRIKIIGSEEEAALSFAAAAATVERGTPVLMFDTGGGSTELVFGWDSRVAMRVSAPVGALTLFDAYLKTDDRITVESYTAARAFVQETFLRAGFEKVKNEASAFPYTLIGVGGTASVLGSTALGLEYYDREKIEGFALMLTEVERQISLYTNSTTEMRKSIPGMPEDRAEIVPAGALLVERILLLTERPAFSISTCGLRFGAMAELLSESH